MIIAIIVGVLIVGAGAYYIGKSSNKVVPTVVENNLPQDSIVDTNTATNQQAKDEQASVPEKSIPSSSTSINCSNIQFTPPQPGILGQQIPINSTLLAASWRYPGGGIPDTQWEYGVFKCQNGAWNQVYISQSEYLETITLSLLPQQSILVVYNYAGAGISSDWRVIYNNGNSWIYKLGDTIRNQALAQIGYIFMGYNGVSVSNGNIVEILPGYVNGDPRCCPSTSSKTATYSWNGSIFGLISVQ